MNLEMAATMDMLAIAEQIRPADCCLVPERREELTTEGGLDVAGQKEHLTDYCAALAEARVVLTTAGVEVHTAAIEVGQGLVTVCQQIARTVLGADRVLAGSDYPHPEGLAEPWEFAEELDGLDETQQSLIMRDNFERLVA